MSLSTAPIKTPSVFNSRVLNVLSENNTQQGITLLETARIRFIRANAPSDVIDQINWMTSQLQDGKVEVVKTHLQKGL